MKKFYIDFTNGATGTADTKYHGGADFCRYISKKIIQSTTESEYNIVCLVKKEYKACNQEEVDLFETMTIDRINSLLEVDYKEEDILFLPMLDSFQVNIIKPIKKKYPLLNIYCVLHGLRLIDVSKYDKYDKYYYSGIRRLGIYTWLRRKVASMIAIRYLRKYIPSYDRVYTVSNNSMQEILQYGNPKYIKYFYRDINRDEEVSHNQNDYIDKGYALFVNANRYEKNFIRSLLAFNNYIKKTDSQLKLYVLGAKSSFVSNLHRIPQIDWDCLEDKVVFFDYVSKQELTELYNHCSFLLYTSKSEGFGLPPLEALNSLKPTVASRLTSIPEVLGIYAYYVDPYSVEDIIKGISYMDNNTNRETLQKQLFKIRDDIVNRGRLDISAFVEELLK